MIEEADTIDLYNANDEVLQEIKTQAEIIKEELAKNKTSIANPNLKFSIPKVHHN